MMKLCYPPVAVEKYEANSLAGRAKVVLSVAQFRPEKDHAGQLRAFALFRTRHPKTAQEVKLIMLGGARQQADKDRVRGLQKLSEELGIAADVEWIINADYSVLLEASAKARVGLHCMWNEHFGISIVEYMV